MSFHNLHDIKACRCLSTLVNRNNFENILCSQKKFPVIIDDIISENFIADVKIGRHSWALLEAIDMRIWLLSNAMNG